MKTCPKCDAKECVTIISGKYTCTNCEFVFWGKDLDLLIRPTLNAAELEWVNCIGWSG